MKTLISQAELKTGITSMSADINKQLGSTPLTVICVLTGSIILVADLIRHLEMPMRLGALSASSYKGNTVRDTLTLDAHLLPNLQGQHVLIVDDIFDTGRTLESVIEKINFECNPVSVSSLTLLKKKKARKVNLIPDFVGFEVDDLFLVGYGLDYQGRYRNLPMIGELKREIITNPSS